MNKWLLLGNVALMVLLVGLILGGCTSSNGQLVSLANQVQANRAAIAQLEASVAQQSQQLQTQAAQIVALQTNTQASLQALSASVQQYVQQYVAQNK